MVASYPIIIHLIYKLIFVSHSFHTISKNIDDDDDDDDDDE